MKHRFAEALLAVAIAVVGSQAGAMAPVIADIPGVIVGDEASLSAPNLFVYPDAFSLDSKVSDDNVLDANIQWSYTGTGKYRLNNRFPLDMLTEDIILPGDKRIDSGLDDPDAVDTDHDTVTFRNKDLSPPFLGNTDPPGTGIIASETEVVTVFASDGTTAGTKSFLVFTDDDGNDRLSGTFFTPVIGRTESTGGLGWTSSVFSFETDGSTPVDPTMTDNAAGMCIDVPLTGNRLGTWTGPYNIVSLVQNAVFRFRLEVDTAGEVLPDTSAPLWDFVIDNFSPAGPVVIDNKFNGDYLFYDNLGGANSPSLAATVGRGTFDVVWCPAAITAADWNDAATGIFRAGNDLNNDIRLAFRVFDTDTSGYGAEFDDGAICLRSYSVDRIDISDLTTQAVLYDAQTLTDADTGGSHHVTTVFNNTTTITFAGGNITIAPDTGGLLGDDAWDLEVIDLIAGNRIFDPLGNPAETADNFPIDWQTNQLLKIEVGTQANNALGETNPPDVVRIGADTPSIELLSIHNITAALDTIGLPKVGAETVYTAFFYTHNRSIATTANIQTIRPRFGIINFDGILSGGSANNLGGIQINFERVSQVKQPVDFN
jgi:hypothetical protein